MLPLEHRVEIWDNLRAIKLGVIPNKFIGESSYYVEEVNGDYSIQLELVFNILDLPTFQYIQDRNHIFLYEVFSSDLPRKFRIKGITQNDDTNGTQKVTVHAEHILFDLLDEVIPITTIYNTMTLGNLKAKILSGSAFSNGTDTTALNSYIIDTFTVGGRNRLDQLKDLTDKVKGRLVVGDDLSVKIVIKPDIVSTNPSVIFMPKSGNIFSLNRNKDSKRIVSRMYGVGGGTPQLSLDNTWHPIESSSVPAGGQVSLRIYKLGLSLNNWTSLSSGPLTGRKYYVLSRYDRAYYGTTDYYKVIGFTPEKDGTGTPDEIIIQNTSPRPAWSFSSNANGNTDIALFYSDSGTDYVGPFLPVNYLEDRDAYNLYNLTDGISERSDLEFTENLFFDPFLSRRPYSAGKHPNIITLANTYITPIGAPTPTYSDNTDLTYIRNGSHSQKVETTLNGQGCMITCYPQFKSNDSIYFSIKCIIYVKTGSLRLECLETGADPLVSPIRQNVFPPANTSDPITITTNGGFVEVTFNGIKNEAKDPILSGGGSTAMALCVFQNDNNTAEFYIDSVQCEPSPGLSDTYIEGTSKKLLWNQCYNDLKNVRTVFETFEITCRDLFNEGINSYWDFSAGDVVRVKNEQYSIDSKVYCNKKQVDILNPGNVVVELLTRVDREIDRTGDIYLALQNNSAQIASVVSKTQNQLIINTGLQKQASVMEVDNPENKYLSAPQDSYGQGSGSLGQIVWAGHVDHGCFFLDKLIVEEGRKVVFIFMPTQTSLPSPTVLDNYHADYFGYEMQLQVSDVEFRSFNISGFSLFDDSGTPVQCKFIKTYILAGYESSRTPDANWDGTTKPTVNNSNSFTSFIPPGVYTNLTLISFGEKGSGGRNLMYSGSLIMFNVPLLRTTLDQLDISPGDINMKIKTSDTGTASQQMIHKGIVSVGSGSNKELVYIQGNRSSDVGTYENTSRYLLPHMPFVYNHVQGEEVIEVSDGIPNGNSLTFTVSRSVVFDESFSVTVV